MTQYVALLRGINIGGRNQINMLKLKGMFESLGFLEVSTYINSGNVIFRGDLTSEYTAELIEKEIAIYFDLNIRVHIIQSGFLRTILGAIPQTWRDTSGMLTHVAFLWEEVDTPHIIEATGIDPTIKQIKYIPGALLWNVELKTWTKDRVSRYLNTKAGQKMTVRNIRTVEKLLERITQ